MLAIVNNTAVNTEHLYSFEFVFWVSLDIVPEVESWGHKAVSFLII